MKKILGLFVVLTVFFATMCSAEVRVSISGGERLSHTELHKLWDAFPTVGVPNPFFSYVRLPFDEEYKIILDNKDKTRRALVNIRVDGRKATGNGLILREGERVDLERFLDSGSLTKGKKFKFIPKSDEPLRTENKEDGKVVVSVQYEKSKKPIVQYEDPPVRAYSGSFPGQIVYTPSSYGTLTSNTSAINVSDSRGITVEGSESRQRFQKDEIGQLEGQEDTLTVELVGYYKTPPVLLKK